MKHFADNNNKKSAPKHSAKHAAGRHYTDEPAADRFAGAVDGALKKLSSLKGRQKETPKTEAREEAEMLYDDPPVEFPMDYPEDYPEDVSGGIPEDIPGVDFGDTERDEPIAVNHEEPEETGETERPEETEDPEKTETGSSDGETDISVYASTRHFPAQNSGTADGDGDTEAFTETNPEPPEMPRKKYDSVAIPTAPEPETRAGYAPAFLFAGFIALMALWFIVAPKQSYSASEKRVLAEFPDTTPETVLSGQFGKDFETYFADHFPARNLWVGVNAYTNLAEGNNGAGGVYNCRDGYLINKPVSTENQIDNNLEMLVDFKSEIGGVPMTAMFVPSTGYIVSDKLPLVHDRYNDDLYFDKISQTLEDGGISFVDLRDSFKRAYQYGGTQLYYKTDHHWTTQGAYIAYREYCKRFDLLTAPQEAFTVDKYPGFYGTTYSKSGFWFTPSDSIEVWSNPDNTDGRIGVTISDGDQTVKAAGSPFFYEHLLEDDKYPIFIDGNHAKTVITNQSKSGTIIVIKDSFSHCFAPFLMETYGKVILLDMRYFNQDVTQIVKEENPSQVLVLYGIDNFAEDTDIGHLWG